MNNPTLGKIRFLYFLCACYAQPFYRFPVLLHIFSYFIPSLMDLRKKVNLIIYRFRERGLEVFLLNDSGQENDWAFPQGDMQDKESDQSTEIDRMITLDPVQQADGDLEEGWAVEGDWHEIPSLKSMLYEDAMQLKEKIKGMEKGTYMLLKDALKKVLPHQYEMLKELKDILTDRNSVKDL